MYYDGTKAIAKVLYTTPSGSKVVYCDRDFFILEENINDKNKLLQLYYYPSYF